MQNPVEEAREARRGKHRGTQSARRGSGGAGRSGRRENRVGVVSMGAAVPERMLSNEHWREKQPQTVAEIEGRLRMWRKPTERGDGSKAFDRAAAPYGPDPFRGARQRRFLSPGETALSLEAKASRDALEAASLAPEDVDLLICSSFLGDEHGIGGATFLARELGLTGAAWNLESACSSSLVALETAAALVESGRHKNVLLVTSCTYSRCVEESDPISVGVGDGAAAMVVGAVTGGAGLLGSHTVHTAETCGAMSYDLEVGPGGEPRFRLRTGPQAAQLLRATCERYLEECVQRAVTEAGVELADVDHFVCATPVAWYASFCTEVLGLDRGKTLSVYPLYGNAGPAILGLNLLHAAHWRSFRPGDLVLLYSFGSVSSSSAAVVRWGEVGLGALPRGVSPELLQRLEHRPRRLAWVA